MTSRELVTRCINYDGPDRCPCCLPEPYINDLCIGGIGEDPDWKPWRTWECEGYRQWEDEWHNVWKCLPNTTSGEVIEGVIKDWSDLDSYIMPRLDLPLRYEGARDLFSQNQDKYRLGVLRGFPFALMRYMRRIEEFLADVLLYPDEVNALQRRIVDLLKGCMTQWARVGADGVFFCEDWGTQERLLVSPKTWHEMFEWGFRELVGHADSLGLTVWMHSCGYIKDIIPTLADIGVKVLQLHQPTLSGLDFLAQTCKGKTAIWAPVDIQRDLPTGNEPYIRERARELIDKLGSNGGGFICGYYNDIKSLGVKPEWQGWAHDEFTKYAGSVARK
ncbi:MAG: uroporphyrinogen decarboxylase family protein [Armatimonadota bacterium]